MVGMSRTSLNDLSLRQWGLVGASLWCAACGGYLLWADDDVPIAIVQHIETTPPPTLEITGLSAAAKRTALRNPFTDAHERRGEISSAAETAEIKTKMLPPHPAPLSVQVSAAVRVPSPAQLPLVLRGVVTGVDGTRIAILARGADGVALGIGETWQGHTLRALSDTSATLDSASGKITLTRE